MDFKKKINFFEKNKFFCELIEKNNEGLEIIRGLIIFVLDILMNYNTNFFMFFLILMLILKNIIYYFVHLHH